MKVKISDFLQVLINCSEKGANIARVIRTESALLQLLVEEKTGEQKNQRFVQDFKTLADVLVQEMVRHELSKQYPEITDRVHGEESNKFTNALGDSVIVKMQDNKDETISLLSTVLNDNERAVELLADVLHTDVSVENGELDQHLDNQIEIADIGLWVDPIDSTAQYIQGEKGVMTSLGMVEEGLQCVTVLIGVYDLTSGLPVIGIANQPFCQFVEEKKRWQGSITWGVCLNDVKAHSRVENREKTRPGSAPVILMSTSESKVIQEKLGRSFNLQYAAGAGYKLLCVIQSLADAYLLSKDTVYKWDSCGPHAILRSMGGGILNYRKLLGLVNENKNLNNLCDLSSYEVLYNTKDTNASSGQFCNKGGLIAYHDFDLLKDISKELTKI